MGRKRQSDPCMIAARIIAHGIEGRRLSGLPLPLALVPFTVREVYIPVTAAALHADGAVDVAKLDLEG